MKALCPALTAIAYAQGLAALLVPASTQRRAPGCREAAIVAQFLFHWFYSFP